MQEDTYGHQYFGAHQLDDRQKCNIVDCDIGDPSDNERCLQCASTWLHDYSYDDVGELTNFYDNHTEYIEYLIDALGVPVNELPDPTNYYTPILTYR